jgi:hypothetical protein
MLTSTKRVSKDNLRADVFKLERISTLSKKKKHNMPILFLSLQTMVITPESC